MDRSSGLTSSESICAYLYAAKMAPVLTSGGGHSHPSNYISKRYFCFTTFCSRKVANPANGDGRGQTLSHKSLISDVRILK